MKLFMFRISKCFQTEFLSIFKGLNVVRSFLVSVFTVESLITHVHNDKVCIANSTSPTQSKSIDPLTYLSKSTSSLTAMTLASLGVPFNLILLYSFLFALLVFYFVS